MSETRTVDEGWDESLDSDQVTHVKSDPAVAAAVSGEWLVNVEDQAVIPMSTTDVVEALRTRRINDRALVWRVGMQDWTALADVPPLRLAAGKLQPPVAPPAPIAAPVSARPSSLPPTSSQRSLRPPPKESARAARDERQRKNTLPFGFPAVAKSAAPRPTPSESPAKREDSVSGALAVYERAPASLTFADSVRAEWNGTKLSHQPSKEAKSPVRASVPPSSRPLTPRKPILIAPLQQMVEQHQRTAVAAPAPEKPRLALEPQSDPVQSARPEPRLMPQSPLQSNTLAPTTSEADYDPTIRQPMWGDLSVVLAADLREAQRSSRRIVIAASLGSALFASLVTLWIARSALHANAPLAAAQPVAVETAKPVATFVEAARPAPVEPEPAPAAEPSVASVAKAAATHAPVSVAGAPAPRARWVAPARAVAKPKLAPAAAQPAAPEVDSQSPQADANPYADPAPAKASAPSAKDSSESADAPKAEPSKPATPSTPKPSADGSSDGEGTAARSAPAAAPGF